MEFGLTWAKLDEMEYEAYARIVRNLMSCGCDKDEQS